MAWDQPFFGDLSLAAASASFPGAVMTPRVYRDRVVGGGTISGSFVVPANGLRKLPVPLSRASLSATVGGSARAFVETTPSSGQIKLDRLTGVWTFHASDVAGTCAWEMVPYVTTWMGEDLAWLQGELAATQTAVLGVGTATTVIHVSKSGDDGTGTGSAGRPYLTVGAAVAAIGTPSVTNRYVVDIGPGVFDEAVVLRKSYVTLRGAGIHATVIRHDVAASASSGLYAGPLKIHTGTWNTSHSGDTGLTNIVVQSLTLQNQPTVDDGDVYCALCIGDPTRALAVSAIEAPSSDVLLEDCRLLGYRDALTICGRAEVTVRYSVIRGTLDVIFPIGANLTLLHSTIENTSSGANAILYLCGTETINIRHCTLLCDSSGATGAISIRTDPRDTSGVTCNVSNTHVGTTGAHGTLRPLLLTVNNSTTSTINIGRGNTYSDTGHRGAPSGGLITINEGGASAMANVAVFGDRYTPGSVKARYTDSNTSGTTGPQVIAESLESNGTRNPQLVTRHADLASGTNGAINPTYTPAAFTASGLVLGEWIAQTYQPNGVWVTAARIQAVQDATMGNGNLPSKWLFQTCASGSDVLTTRWTINADGTCVASSSVEGVSWKFPADSTFVTTLSHTTSTANRTIVFPDASGTVAVSASTPLALSAAGALSIQAADASHNGYLSSTDWSTFNGKGSGTVTTCSVVTANGVSGSVANASTTPAITLTLAAITPSRVTATDTRWQDFAAQTICNNGVSDYTAPSGWVPITDYSGTCLLTYGNGEVVLARVPYMAGTTLRRVRVKWQGEGAGDGLTLTLVKRDESGTATAFSTVATTSPTTSTSVTLTTWDISPDEVLADGYSYAVLITGVVASTSSKIFSVGFETSGRVY